MTNMAPLPAPAATTEPLVSLAHASATDPERCGNKAATLARLSQAGFPVPPGVVLPVDATPTRGALERALATLGGPVAVRSSGTAEDGPHASWAGQYASFLNVSGTDAVLRAIEGCLASARSAHARAYAASHEADAGVAVLIQRMVPADTAGVAFSANPVTGDVDACVVSATSGLADRLVAGEVDADEWTVRSGQASPIATPQGALDASAVAEIAALARAVADALGAPQDIEWARAGGELRLVQARPIVDLPLEPQFPAPKGNWTKDSSFFVGPITPLGETAFLAWLNDAVATMCSEWGLIPDGVVSQCFGHESYSQMVPDDVSKPPPWWILGIAARLIPSIRRKLRKARDVVDAGMLESVPDAWPAVRQGLADRLAGFQAVDLSALDDDALLAHVEQLVAFSAEGQVIHFRLFIPYCVGMHELHQVCATHLGWEPAQTMELMQGLSQASSGPVRALRSIAALVSDDPASRAVIERAAPDFIAQLDAINPTAAQELRDYTARWGWRCVDYDPGVATLAEQPHRLAELVGDLLDGPSPSDLETRRQQRIAQARTQVSGSALRHFDTTLAYAERVYPQREDNIIYTDSLPGGLLRRAALEVGRRLTQRGLLADRRDVAYLELSELRSLKQPPADLGARAARRRREMAWVRAHPGPAIYGKRPAPSPNVRGLPEAARRINGALLWMFDLEHRPAATPSDGGLAGLPASGGVYRGAVRVVRHPTELHTLRRGEVLVCPITSPAWAAYFGRAGALITDSGSVLSHAAIIAREHAVPAVVATQTATTTLRDGMDVTVDGTRGTVTIHA